MLRWLTAGESHGPELVAILEGLPAGVRGDHGRHRRGAAPPPPRLRPRRPDEVRAGRGDDRRRRPARPHAWAARSPSASATPSGPSGRRSWRPTRSTPSARRARPATRRCSRPRPGHADLAGMQKYGFDDARPVLERASARETAARVALGEVARRFLKQALGVDIVSHVVAHRRRSQRPPTASARPRRPGRGSTPTRCAASTPTAAPRWSRRSTRRTRTATRSAASSRCSPTACRRAWAATSTGTAASTPGWPAR